MAKIFLDTNVFIDLIEGRADIKLDSLVGHRLYISPLSVHILNYIYKYSLPTKNLAKIDQFFSLVPFDKQVTTKALNGPSKDFEDNVQLHSCAHAECEIFLTQDKNLLEMKFFGKATIKSYL